MLREPTGENNPANRMRFWASRGQTGVITNRVKCISWDLHFILDTRVVGPFLASPAKSLPSEIDQFFQKAGDEGVILVSFGTVVEAISDSLLKIMAETFSKLPQKIIWKLKPNGMSVWKNKSCMRFNKAMSIGRNFFGLNFLWAKSCTPSIKTEMIPPYWAI